SQALLATFRAVEVEAYQTLAKTYATMMDAATKSPLVRAVWAAVTLSQLAVLLWHQVGIPALVYVTGERYPSSGTTVDWAYALVFGCLGLGPMVMRSGPTGPGGLADTLKRAIGR
ncbi:hypothetical protein, partial [Rhodoplanes sp. SY1]|uniref:hypothetical protein n=1 Tax=Rhodoplanes sp. SY1 TaxID=3166646 RepID=UPI0038B6186B